MKLFLVIQLILVSIAAVSPQIKCPCKKDQKLDEGGCGHMPDQFEDAILKKIQGQVVDWHGDPLENILIEVYDHPEVSRCSGERRNGVEQKRLAACLTGPDGKFCFKNIPPGKYQVLCSNIGFNSSWVKVTLRPRAKRGSNKSLKLELRVGT